jgi:hypothetical protein
MLHFCVSLCVCCVLYAVCFVLTGYQRARQVTKHLLLTKARHLRYATPTHCYILLGRSTAAAAAITVRCTFKMLVHAVEKPCKEVTHHLRLTTPTVRGSYECLARPSSCSERFLTMQLCFSCTLHVPLCNMSSKRVLLSSVNFAALAAGAGPEPRATKRSRSSGGLQSPENSAVVTEVIRTHYTSA